MPEPFPLSPDPFVSLVPADCSGVQEEDVVVVRLRGHHMTTWDEVYFECARVLGFPDSFGHNLMALFDLLRELYWIPAQKIRLVIEDEFLLLYKADPEDKNILLEVFEDACQHAAELMAQEDPDGRDLKVILVDV